MPSLTQARPDSAIARPGTQLEGSGCLIVNELNGKREGGNIQERAKRHCACV